MGAYAADSDWWISDPFSDGGGELGHPQLTGVLTGPTGQRGPLHD